MRNPTREQVAVALFNLLKSISGIKTASRRPALWDDTSAKPALYLGNPRESYAHPHGSASPPIITLDYDVFLYIETGMDPNALPDTQMNTLLDTIEAALAGDANNSYVQTLGGIVNQAWIEGDVNRAGYLDGQGMALFTIRVVVPWGGP